MRCVRLLIIFPLLAPLYGDFPIEEPEPIYHSEDKVYEIPLDGDDSFTDDVDLDEPGPIPPGMGQPSEATEPPASQELVVNLKNPTFSQGVIGTEEGGVIEGEGLRIQAQRIQYTNRIEQGVRVQKISAEGDLMMEYGNRAFVGSRLEYDFVSKTGTLFDGKTFIDIWFLGGEKIELKEDGSFAISSAFITTCESQENSWDINARSIKITEDKLLSAQDIRFRFFKVPLLWLPAFRSNLKAISDSPIRYKLMLDKGLGPRATVRYRLFSWQDMNLFVRLDYRLSRGFGASVESEYFSKENKTTFVTRSYGAHDKTFPDEKGPRRYRLQGLYHKDSIDDRTKIHLTWDKLSDTRMVGDFRSEDFEINTQKRTRFFVQHHRENALFHLNVQPRVNRFDSIDQEIPLLNIAIRPRCLGSSGILSYNTLSGGYLNYVYANDLRKQFHQLGLESSTRSMRLELKSTLSRPIHFSGGSLSPYVGGIGIAYSNNPHSQGAGQAICTYGLMGQTRLQRLYTNTVHVIEPYLDFQGLTRPTSSLTNHFYFDINDGWNQLNQLRIGVKNFLFPLRSFKKPPSLSIDLYTYAFFGPRSFSTTFPRAYMKVNWLQSRYEIRSDIVWNQQTRVWDVANLATDVTVNEDVAFSIEFRHRSRYDWRKADHTSFILDVARPIPELLESPLSDGRNTLLTRFFFRLAPKWTCKIESRTGWGRRNEPAYYAGKVDLITLLTCSWKWRLSYERMPNDNRFSTSVSLVK